jgi:hypothetical protein
LTESAQGLHRYRFTQDSAGHLLIDLAHAMGLAEVRVAILSAMETVTAAVNGVTPLMAAAYGGQKEMVEALLARGARLEVSPLETMRTVTGWPSSSLSKRRATRRRSPLFRDSNVTKKSLPRLPLVETDS